jgi:hypothetical protein
MFEDFSGRIAIGFRLQVGTRAPDRGNEFANLLGPGIVVTAAPEVLQEFDMLHNAAVEAVATELRAMKNYAGHRLSPWLGHLMVSRQETAPPCSRPARSRNRRSMMRLCSSPGAHRSAPRRCAITRKSNCSAASFRRPSLPKPPEPQREFDLAEDDEAPPLPLFDPRYIARQTALDRNDDAGM